MRLEGYLNEEGPVINDLEIITARLKIDCKKFLQESDGQPAFRGNLKRLERGLSRKSGHADTGRKPRDSSEEIHDYLNNLFKKKFGWPVRDGVFVSGSWSQAESYGDVYIFFPIGNYEYVWSPEVDDMWSYLTAPNSGYNAFGHNGPEEFTYLKSIMINPHVIEISMYFKNQYADLPKPKRVTFDQFMKDKYKEAEEVYQKIVATYRDNDLKTALSDGKSEISFRCKDYWLLSMPIYNKIKGKL